MKDGLPTKDLTWRAVELTHLKQSHLWYSVDNIHGGSRASTSEVGYILPQLRLEFYSAPACNRGFGGNAVLFPLHVTYSRSDEDHSATPIQARWQLSSNARHNLLCIACHHVLSHFFDPAVMVNTKCSGWWT